MTEYLNTHTETVIIVYEFTLNIIIFVYAKGNITMSFIFVIVVDNLVTFLCQDLNLVTVLLNFKHFNKLVYLYYTLCNLWTNTPHTPAVLVALARWLLAVSTGTLHERCYGTRMALRFGLHLDVFITALLMDTKINKKKYITMLWLFGTKRVLQMFSFSSYKTNEVEMHTGS